MTTGRVIAVSVILLMAVAGVMHFAAPPIAMPVTTTTNPTPVATVGATEATTTARAGGPAGILPYHSGITGTVMVGPTCPVERTPPDPACADKPLSTTVTVFRKSNLATAFTTAKSDASGAFSFSIPPGDYVVTAGESMLPRCTEAPATVGPSGYTNIVIECDSGIR